MITIITAMLFMFAFKHIEDVKIDAGLGWGFILSLFSLVFTSVYWTVLFLATFIFGTCTLGIGLLFLIHPTVKHFSAITTAPLRMVSALFPKRLFFLSDKGAQVLSAYIFVLAIALPFTLC